MDSEFPQLKFTVHLLQFTSLCVMKSVFIWLSFAAICIIWGTTYFGVKVCIAYFPPFFLSAARYFTAGIIFLIMYLAIGKKMPPLYNLRHSAIAGFIIITGSNALMACGLHDVPSSFAGVLGAMAPIYVTLISILVFKGFKITPLIILGLLLSFVGVFYISQSQSAGNVGEHFWRGFLLVGIANVLWAVGSIYMKRFPVKEHVFIKVAAQMIPAGLLNFFISMAFEPHVQFAAVSAKAWFWLLFLILVGSLLAYLCFVYLIQFWQPARVTTHVYINTIVAVVLGFWLGGEQLNWFIFGNLMVVLVGVILVNNQYAKLEKMADEALA